MQPVTQVEFNAIKKFFLETGRDFSKLSPTEQRKRVEEELERESEGDVSFISSRGSNG